MGGIFFEALRLTMVQRLLSSAEFKMDPLVSLYYFAPVCAVMNFAVALVWEIPKVSMAEVYHVGLFTLFLNGLCAFLLNVSVVFLIGKTSAVVMTLKDIMLVVASIIIWGTTVTALQFFGYSIALAGMVYYKLGYDSLKKYLGEADRRWAEFGAQKPVLRRIAIVVLALLIVFVVLGGLAPTYGADMDPRTYLTSAATRLGIAQ
jgi:drug/metabolite transporter (DMT)-like permease